jgi:hypothetical protein
MPLLRKIVARELPSSYMEIETRGPMHSDFEETNLILYYGLANLFLDAVIWCLGPYVDDSREYGVARLCLAMVTRRLCRTWLQCRGVISDAV